MQARRSEVGRGYLVIEGHGEVKAAQNLIARLWVDLGCSPMIWADPIRITNLVQKPGVARACAIARSKPDAEALLILRDVDDDCPATSAPIAAQWIRDENLPFPVAVVLLCREYETLFLPCLARMAGVLLRDDRGGERPGLLARTRFEGDYQSIRGAKEWLSDHFPRGRNYKPSLDQLPMTRLIHFADLRSSGLASFGTLERGLQFLERHRNKTGVYP